MRSRLLLAVVALAVAPGCSKCGKDHPYVPYAIDEAGPAASLVAADDAGALEPPDAGASFAEVPAAVAPPNAIDWTLDGEHLVAPENRVITMAIVRDFDGDGSRDAVALVRPPVGIEPWDVLVYRGAGATLGSPVVAGSVAPLDTDPACDKPPARQRLGLVGKRSAIVEVSARCAAPSAKDPARWVGVVSLGASPRVRWSTMVIDPPGAPAVTIDVDGADRDGDGLDDVTLRVALEGGAAPFEPGPKVSAFVRWFDRAAGFSRDLDEPDASLRALASAANVRASRPKDAPSVPIAVRQVRALFAAICQEGGAPRLTRVLGGSIACGSSRGLEEAGLAEVRAYATTGDALRAVTALDRAQRPPATKTTSRANDANNWIAQAAPIASNATLRAVGAVPQIDRGKAPAWGALAFDGAGKLLVRTLAGVIRVDPVQGDEVEAGDVPTWKTQVLSPDGSMRWIEAYSACDGIALHATFAPTGDAEPKDVALPIAPPMSARCTTAKGEPAHAIPIAWGAGGLEAIVAGEPVLFSPDLARAGALVAPLEQAGPPGSPRSPSAKVMAVPTPQGILVRKDKFRMFRAKELDGGYGELRDCVVSDDGARVACVRGGRAFVGIWDALP